MSLVKLFALLLFILIIKIYKSLGAKPIDYMFVCILYLLFMFMVL